MKGLDLQQGNLTVLMRIWESWCSAKLEKFSERYGHIGHLIGIEPDKSMKRAMIQFWDPFYRCFTFHEVDMTPTLEEYTVLLGLKLKEHSKIYQPQTGFRKQLTKMFGIPINIFNPVIQRKGKEKENDKENGEVIEPLVADESAGRRKFIDEEAGEFLKLIKQSEYSVVQQLNRTPAWISLLSLFLNSESHCAALLKVFNQAHFSQDMSDESLDNIVGSIVAPNFITSTDDEILVERMGHTKALHISVKCKDHIVARILIDNGSSLNVMPRSTLAKLPVDPSHMVWSYMIVTAFDGTRRQVMGRIEQPI